MADWGAAASAPPSKYATEAWPYKGKARRWMLSASDQARKFEKFKNYIFIFIHHNCSDALHQWLGR